MTGRAKVGIVLVVALLLSMGCASTVDPADTVVTTVRTLAVALANDYEANYNEMASLITAGKVTNAERTSFVEDANAFRAAAKKLLDNPLRPDAAQQTQTMIQKKAALSTLVETARKR